MAPVAPRRSCFLKLSLTAGLLLGGCAGGPSPTPALNRAELGIEDAQEAQAGVYAPAPLALANDKYARARQAADEGRDQTATRLAEQAAIDAERAEAEARATVAQRNLAEVEEGVGVLREETLNNEPQP